MAVHMQLLSDRPVKDYEGFLVDLMHHLDQFRIRGMVVVAIMEEPLKNGTDAVTAYHEMCLRDRQMAASLIQEDVSYKIALDAVRELVDPDLLLKEED